MGRDRVGAREVSGWIKWEKDLEDDPRTLRMARELKRTCNAMPFHPVTVVCGGLIRLWRYADSHIRDDDSLDLGASEIDELVGIPNFCSLMPADWLRQIDANTVELPGFQGHNGVEAKKRALTQKRVARHRDGEKRNSVTQALPDQDQTRPDQDLQKTDMSTASTAVAEVPRGTSKADEEAVFEHWKQTWRHPSAILDAKRRARIRARLQNFTVEQICGSISGFRNSPWHCGTDPKGQGKVYDAIDTLLRDTAQVEEGLRLLANPPRAPPKLETAMDRILRANSADNSRVIEHDPELRALTG